eukprot:scaffold363_cov209-Alexandrium_tamarense.AAC.14
MDRCWMWIIGGGYSDVVEMVSYWTTMMVHLHGWKDMDDRLPSIDHVATTIALARSMECETQHTFSSTRLLLLSIV